MDMNSESPLFSEFDEIAGELWENNAQWWQRGFTEGADPEYEEQIVPLLRYNLTSSHRVLDVGTGEGQLSRIASKVHGVTFVAGIDPTWPQIEEAHKRSSHIAYSRSEAAAIPFSNGSFDTVIACLVFEHISDVAGAAAEVSRVLEVGGTFLFFLNHPLLQTPNSGWIDDHIIGEQYWRIGRYLIEERTVEEVEKDVYIPFIHRPLHTYVNMLAGVGLFLTHMEEPAPPRGFLDKAPEYLEAATIPRLMFMRFTKA